jgi:hypothetical protein
VSDADGQAVRRLAQDWVVWRDAGDWEGLEVEALYASGARRLAGENLDR